MNRPLFAAIALAAACGGAKQETARAPETVADGSDAGAATATATPTATVAAPGEMKPVTPSAYAESLQALGLDPRNLPPLNKIAPEQLRKVMPLVAKSLGVKCNACHDFKAPVQPTVTPRMKVAMRMWNEIVRTRTISPDQPVFCDSCHHGSMTFLDRRDRKAVEDFMDENFVKTLGAERCETCHGPQRKWRFLEDWRR